MKTAKLCVLKMMTRWAIIGLMGAGMLLEVAEPGMGQMRLAQVEESLEAGAIEPLIIEGTLDENSEVLEQDSTYYNVHTFDGQAGQNVSIELASDNFDTYLLLLLPDGSVLSQNDDGEEGTNSNIAITLPTTGTYTILANSYEAGETGRYTLTVQPPSGEAVAEVNESTAIVEALPEPEQLGSVELFTTEGTLDENSAVLEEDGSYYRAYTFEGQTGQTVAIELVSNDFDAYLLLQSPDGTLLGQDDDGSEGNNSRIVVSLTTTGTYTIIAETYAVGETGHYTLSIQPASSQEIAAIEQLAEAEQLNQQVIELYYQEHYADAIPLAERALQLREQALDENHLDVAQNLITLAGLYQKQENVAAAEPIFQQALAIYENALGDNSSSIATSLEVTALLYQTEGNYAVAEPLFQRLTEMRKRDLGENHPDVAQSLNSQANLYREQGNYAAAESLFQQALTILESALGENHPKVAESLHDLAVLYRFQNNDTAAEPLFQRALDIRENALARNHPDVFLSDVFFSLNNLALLYSAQGNYPAAEPLFQRSLAIRENILGENHLDVAESLDYLAVVYSEQGNYAAAELLWLRSLSIRENALGENHLDVAENIDYLADLYLDQGDYILAEPLYQRSLSIRESILGENHLDVATNLSSLGFVYWAQSHYAVAERFHKRSLAIRENILGENHPEVAYSLDS